MTGPGAATAADELRTVRLLQLPVQVWAASQEHHDELLREFALMTAGQADAHDDGAAGAEPGSGVDPASHDGVATPSAGAPLRLLRLVDELTRRFGGTSDAQRELLFAAAVRGELVMDELAYHLPPAARQACVELTRMLDEADDYCRDGEHLLTLATPDDVRLFRDWYLGEMVRQLDGAPPESWPDYAARARGA